MVNQKLQELMDREAIRDCLYRYCRGIDRADEAFLRSAYWPDATDRHGIYTGPVSGFIQLAIEIFKTAPRNIHQVSNILIEFTNGKEAVVESYFTALQRGPDRAGTVRQFLLCGRYCDIFEKREDEWRVADRTVVYDWVEAQSPPDEAERDRFGPRLPAGSPYPNDTIYTLLAAKRASS